MAKDETPPTERKPKFRRRAEARPDEVLDAALELFIEKGYARTRVEDIASRAGLSKGAVYLYFETKQAILEGLVERAVVPVATGAMEMIASHPGSVRDIMTMALRLVAVRLADPMTLAIPRLILHEVAGFPELARLYREKVIDRARPVVAAIIARGVESGEFRPVDPELTIRSVVGPIAVHVILSEIFEIAPEGGLAVDRLIENHLTILFDGLSAPEGGRHG